MRYWVLLTISILILAPDLVLAQVKADKGEIERLEKGKYSFAKGEVQVTFVDSVSPDFIERQLKLLGYEAINLNIHRVVALIKNEPVMEDLAKIEQNPAVNSIEITQNTIPENALLEMFERDSLTVEEQKAARKRFEAFAQKKDIRVFFEYPVNKKKAIAVLESYPNIDFRISMAPIKSGRIKTQVGKEEEVMKSLERLVYVESTAYIGIVKQ